MNKPSVVALLALRVALPCANAQMRMPSTGSEARDGIVALLDDAYVEGSSETVARTDMEGNTYQIRVAPDSDRYEIPKTYPSDSALRKKLASSEASHSAAAATSSGSQSRPCTE